MKAQENWKELYGTTPEHVTISNYCMKIVFIIKETVVNKGTFQGNSLGNMGNKYPSNTVVITWDVIFATYP